MASERLEWIRRRNAVGFDWSQAVEAMAQVKVEPAPEGLVVDTSAINTRGQHWPTRALLRPVGDGEWLFDATGHRAPLVEWLWTMTLSAIGDRFRPPLAVTAAPDSEGEGAE